MIICNCDICGKRPALVGIESPYAGEITRNLRYFQACQADCFSRGEAPYGSHGLYTQPGVLSDDVPKERRKGIEAGYAWAAVADKIAFYTDFGWSRGMQAALAHHQTHKYKIEERQLGAQILQKLFPKEFDTRPSFDTIA
jgi:hypothetical protein